MEYIQFHKINSILEEFANKWNQSEIDQKVDLEQTFYTTVDYTTKVIDMFGLGFIFLDYVNS